jgi:hypothetical protein
MELEWVIRRRIGVEDSGNDSTYAATSLVGNSVAGVRHAACR